MRPALLCVLDGLGLSEAREGNAVAQARMPHLKGWMRGEGSARLRASGLDVGLPKGVMGNSEVGHLALGSGRVVFQAFARIGLAIEDGSFFENPVLGAAMDASKGRALHLAGLLSVGGVHGDIAHVEALLELARRRGQHDVILHAILDGRDMPPRSCGPLLARLEAAMREKGVGRVATVGGRYWGMDRDQRWDRVQAHFDAMVHGTAPQAKDAAAAVEAAYARGESDEFVKPTRVLPGDEGLLRPGDHVLLWNFRPDRMRQLAAALSREAFEGFPRGGAGPWPTTSMATYDASFGLPVAFPAEEPRDTLGEVVARTGKAQLRIAETEKYAHVTYFFNGGREGEVEGEERVLVPSRRDHATYDKVPEMSAGEVTDALLARLAAREYALVVLNLANCDMVGHTGDLEAAVKACEVVDQCLGRIVPAARAKGYEVFITADHGNAEVMRRDGQPQKAHTTNMVPLVYVGSMDRALRDGGLADVAPTVLEAMGLEKPAGMRGASLLV